MENKKIFKNTFHLLHTLMLYSFLSLLFLPPSPFPTHPLSPKRMLPSYSCWRTGLLLLLLLAVTVKESWQVEEKTCDLVGEPGRESEKELALLKRLKPLFGKR